MTRQQNQLGPSPGMSAPLVTFENATFRYGEHIALQNISLTLPRHSLTAVMGPNGGGKSTLLKALMETVPAVSGKIHRHSLPQKRIAYLPQQAEVDKSFPVTVFDTVAMGLWHAIGPFKAFTQDAEERVMTALEEVGVEHCAERCLGALSGGQLQRVLFARLSLQEADLILLDEPFNNLDQPTLEDLLVLIKGWHRKGKTIITVLHDLDLIRTHFPECIILARTLIAHGPTQEVMTVENFAASYVYARQWHTT